VNAQELMVAYGTSLLVRKGCGSAPWYEAIKWFPGQMSGLSGNLERLSSNLNTLYSNQGGLSSNPVVFSLLDNPLRYAVLNKWAVDVSWVNIYRRKSVSCGNLIGQIWNKELFREVKE